MAKLQEKLEAYLRAVKNTEQVARSNNGVLPHVSVPPQQTVLNGLSEDVVKYFEKRSRNTQMNYKVIFKSDPRLRAMNAQVAKENHEAMIDRKRKRAVNDDTVALHVGEKTIEQLRCLSSGAKEARDYLGLVSKAEENCDDILGSECDSDEEREEPPRKERKRASPSSSLGSLTTKFQEFDCATEPTARSVPTGPSDATIKAVFKEIDPVIMADGEGKATNENRYHFLRNHLDVPDRQDFYEVMCWLAKILKVNE